MPDYAEQRFHMVASQVLASGVTDERILAAMQKVERERFVPIARRAVAYAESAVEVVQGRFLTDPRNFALMLNAAEISRQEKVLDVGCATGYSTAVLAELADRVVGLEQDADLVRIAGEALLSMHVKNATIVQGVLVEGFGREAPYDVMLINGGVETVPPNLLAQLAPGGRLIAVVGMPGHSKAVVYLKDNDRTGRRIAFDASLPMLSGFRQPAGFVF